MNVRYKRLTTGITVLLMFSIAQVYVAVSFAGADTRPRRAVTSTLDPTGILVTSGKQAILVNGNNAVTDATILSGASIESPQGVSATVNLGRLGRLDLAPATTLRLDFSAGKIKVTLFKGCVILLTRRNTTGTIETPKGGVVGTTDPSKDDVIDVCQREGAATPLVNQGAAADAGAGAGSASAAGTNVASSAAQIGGGTSSAGGLSHAAGVLIGGLGMGAMIVAAVVLPCDRGVNPSPQVSPQQCR